MSDKIFGEKDGDPIEVYPVWNDENYLKGIILQSRGKLKGNYYIITPETCTVAGDTAMKNSAGNEVHFKMLKFPYKILEDVSRNFQIQQQPDYLRFLYIAFGSLRELHYQLNLSKRLGFLPNEDPSMIEPKIVETEKVLNGLIRAL